MLSVQSKLLKTISSFYYRYYHHLVTFSQPHWSSPDLNSDERKGEQTQKVGQGEGS